MHDDGIDYDAIEYRVTRRLQRRYRFFLHSAVFLIGIPIIGQWNAAELFLIWVAIWVFHLIWVNYQAHLEQAIKQEIEQERRRRFKRKREFADDLAYDEPQRMQHASPPRLGDDGELYDSDAEDYRLH